MRRVVARAWEALSSIFSLSGCTRARASMRTGTSMSRMTWSSTGVGSWTAIVGQCMVCFEEFRFFVCGGVANIPCCAWLLHREDSYKMLLHRGDCSHGVQSGVAPVLHCYKMLPRHGSCSHGVQSGVAPLLQYCIAARLHATTPWELLSRCAIWGCSSIAISATLPHLESGPLLIWWYLIGE